MPQARSSGSVYQRAKQTQAIQHPCRRPRGRLAASAPQDDLEAAFSRQLVSNPYSGELIKGHRIVMAESGLAPFHGKIVRDPATFQGGLSKPRRLRHILARFAFVRELFGGAGLSSVVL